MLSKSFVVVLFESLSQQAEKVNEGTGMTEERMVGKLTVGDLISLAADLFFEFLDIQVRESEKFLYKKEMEEFLLDFGVH